MRSPLALSFFVAVPLAFCCSSFCPLPQFAASAQANPTQGSDGQRLSESEVERRRSQADQINDQGLQQLNTSQYQIALQSFQQALEIYREIGDRRGEGTTLNNIGGIYDSLGQYPQALDFYQQALVIAKDINDRRREGTRLNNIAGSNGFC
jgi:tetratricopeptide (TPR) repeat protein